MTRQIQKTAISASISLAIFCSSYSAFAGPGTLASTPLFVSNAVEPNVFLTIDDSGSMNWEMLYPEGLAGVGYNTYGQTQVEVSGRTYTVDFWNPEWHTSGGTTTSVVPPVSYNADFWLFRNHEANKIYYNPATTYSPWPGVDANNDALYEDADPLAVRKDPNSSANTSNITETKTYIRSNSDSADLYLPIYYTWTDTDGDGEIEASDQHDLFEIQPNTPEMINFANWLQYYRKRQYSTKAAIGSVINNTDNSRMGLDLINSGLQLRLKSMTDSSNKLDLLESFYTSDLETWTPLRLALQRVGEMFASSTAPTAILPEAEGGACQKNFNLLMTDGYWNGNSPRVGNTDISTSADDGFDGDEDESIDEGNYEDGYSDTLADVAMHYYENDLSSLDDKVPPNPGVDLATHQHLVNYTVSFGLEGSLDPTQDPTAATFPGWTDPEGSSASGVKIDDLWHAAYNSRGLYLNAQNPEELSASLKAAVSDIADRTATAAAASVTSAKLTTESIVYLAEFNTNRWQGTIYAHKILNFDTGELNPVPEWSASDELNSQNPNDRVILTFDGVTTNDGIPFRWTNDLTTAIKDDLRTNGAGGTDSDTIAEARLNYIRGDRSNEATGEFFRERATILGDIVNSGPVYVGKPALRWPDSFPVGNVSTPYSDFKTAQESRRGVVYVGANDGMLHGFDETTGQEILAYISSNLFSTSSDKGLHYLTEQNYTHQFYNDLTPSVSDIYINGSWATVLISGQRGGGRGYYALDITNPNSFSELNTGPSQTVMWEFTSDDDSNLGYSFSKPQIGMTNDGKWVAIFGNGYNGTGDNTAKLFIVDIEAGADGSWDAGDYTVISTGTTHDGGANGLATPALADLDGNGTIDRAYAGDLNGDMWAFDLSASSSGSWATAYGEGNPLFTTEGSQPITSKPILSFHPTEPNDGSNSPNVMVFFGSGQYLVESDKDLSLTISNDHYFYGVWDKGTDGLTRTNLVEQTYRSGFSTRVLTQNAVDYGTYFGWNISLPDTGERSITSSAVRGDIVFFNSSVPSDDPCSTGGYGYRFAVDVATGGTPDEAVLDIDKDGEINSDDTIGVDQDVQSADRLSSLPTDNTFTEKVGYTGKDPFAIQELDSPNYGRFSWQELLK